MEVAGEATTSWPGWGDLHESVVIRVVEALDLRSRMALLCTCSRLRRLCARPELWRNIFFADADAQRGLRAEWLLGVLERAGGGVEVLHLARSREAAEAEGAARFSCGLKIGQVLPHTQGPGAGRLAALLPRLAHISIDERASCLGGMTNALARALGARCPLLRTVEVYFERYSLPSELLTDEGVIALSEGARGLRALTLVNCDYVSDRSLYAVAANCRGLRELRLGGYSENISDFGLTVLVESCTGLQTLWLSGRLLKVTDDTAAALARHCGAAARRAKLTRSMGPAAVAALARRCPGLEELDARHCRGDLGDSDVAALARACPRLARLALPPGPAAAEDAGGAAAGPGGQEAGGAPDAANEAPGAAAAAAAVAVAAAARPKARVLLADDLARLRAPAAAAGA